VLLKQEQYILNDAVAGMLALASARMTLSGRNHGRFLLSGR
jgi:hypothetical protein